MNIHHKSAFLTGVLCVCALVLFALHILDADWWQWLISIAIAARFLYAGLTGSGSQQSQKLREQYREAAASLHGKRYLLKTNLPLVLIVIFYPAALLLRFLFNVYLPIWIHVGFVMVLAVSAAYSIGIERSIRAYMDSHIPDGP